ncbi:hypothetical protein B7463_g3161, partial [Scytalidium lignicola]
MTFILPGQDPGGMTEKDIHDWILQEIAKIYTPEQLTRITWCRQLRDDKQSVELTLHADVVDELAKT